MKASIIIPVYNQYIPLRLTIQGFCNQNVDGSLFEVVIIDDGSDVKVDLNDIRVNFDMKIIRQDNAGRAVARNTGIKAAEGEIIIFNDADRIPVSDFVSKHLEKHAMYDNAVIIGNPKELYISDVAHREEEITKYIYNNRITKFSRNYGYASTISNLYKVTGETDSKIPWISFFSGNSSVKRRILEVVGLFDPQFRSWGFEHFELGYRLYQNGYRFYFAKDAINMHITHQREAGFYQENFKNSVKLFSQIRNDSRIEELYKFMTGELSLQALESVFGGNGNSIGNTEAIYFTKLV